MYLIETRLTQGAPDGWDWVRFFGLVSELGQFPFSQLCSLQPPVMQPLGASQCVALCTSIHANYYWQSMWMIQIKVKMIFETLFKVVTRVQIFIFRRTQGKRMAYMRGMPILLLNTVGRKSGKSRTTPLMYFRDGENYVITASNLGRDQYPSWFYNLKNSSQVEIEVPGQRLVVSPSIASESEQARLWPQLVAQAPFFDEYRKGTTRPIPLVLLRPHES